ncbi:DUF3422 domain-containing protein [Sphingorhabdus sp. EL138]|uniref:DUF3422 domain-containing protein n=1 Tax=Sphingorhabdus sp. EL138 TaxID=2073156 RepID=UPI0025E66FCE|nr:DUF3422 domain-containing protein [Sphingorhabdus sp. EL138]
MSFTEHPLRRWAVDEMRLRRFAPVTAHSDVYQVVRLIEPDERNAEDRWLINARPDFDNWALAPRHGSGHTLSGIHFLWERHTEASTLTLIFPQETPEPVRHNYIKWLENWPGGVVRATQIGIVPSAENIDAELSAIGISTDEMVCCDINGGIRLWSDFSIHGDGYGRLLITAGDVGEGERGRIIQRVQELGNYRNLALLGFPVVQQYGPQLDQLEHRLSDHARRVASADEDDEILLNDLAAISSELELIRSATGFRLSATAAYAEVAADRLASLDVQPILNFQSLTDFTERRLVPASRTCSVFRKRLGDIAERVSGVMHTLDVRIDSRIKAQNLVLMRSMERSTQLQFRLQTLVEGLSVIAAAYYLVGLIAYMTKGVAATKSGSISEIFVGAVTLPIVLLIYFFVNRLRHKVLMESGAENADTEKH